MVTNLAFVWPWQLTCFNAPHWKHFSKHPAVQKALSYPINKNPSGGPSAPGKSVLRHFRMWIFLPFQSHFGLTGPLSPSCTKQGSCDILGDAHKLLSAIKNMTEKSVSGLWPESIGHLLPETFAGVFCMC